MASTRKVVFINPRFQGFFLGFMLGMNAIVLGIVYLSQVYFFSEFERMGVTLGLPPDHALFRFMAEQRFTLNQIFAVVAGVSFVFSTFFALVVSHRIAGPLYRLKGHMIRVALGATRSEVHFRDGDFFPEIARAYNLQLRRLRRDLERVAVAQMEQPEDAKKSRPAA
jgi:sensor histidine kinase YesM